MAGNELPACLTSGIRLTIYILTECHLGILNSKKKNNLLGELYEILRPQIEATNRIMQF